MAHRKDAWFTDGELAQFNHRLEQVSDRHTYEQDPDAYIREHREMGCRVFKANIGILVHGPDFKPMKRVEEEKHRG